MGSFENVTLPFLVSFQLCDLGVIPVSEALFWVCIYLRFGNVFPSFIGFLIRAEWTLDPSPCIRHWTQGILIVTPMWWLI